MIYVGRHRAALVYTGDHPAAAYQADDGSWRWRCPCGADRQPRRTQAVRAGWITEQLSAQRAAAGHRGTRSKITTATAS